MHRRFVLYIDLATVTCQYVLQQNAKHVCGECVYTASPAGSPQPLLQTDLWKVKVVAWTAAPAASSSTCDSDLRGKQPLTKLLNS